MPDDFGSYYVPFLWSAPVQFLGVTAMVEVRTCSLVPRESTGRQASNIQFRLHVQTTSTHAVTHMQTLSDTCTCAHVANTHAHVHKGPQFHIHTIQNSSS